MGLRCPIAVPIHTSGHSILALNGLVSEEVQLGLANLSLVPLNLTVKTLEAKSKLGSNHNQLTK
jgi:hypothetical protein